MNTAPRTLQVLSQAAIDCRGMPARQVALEPRLHGKSLTISILKRMGSDTFVSIPRENTFKSLAKVSAEAAFAAAGQLVPGLPLEDELPPGSENLSPQARRVVIDLQRVLIDLENVSNEPQTRTLTESAFSQEQGDGPASGEEQKSDRAVKRRSSPGPTGIEFGLAAHPNMKMVADRTDEYFNEADEENQDRKE